MWDHAARERAALAVVMIDIDHFKAYNDRYGHQAGDACLRNVADAVRRTARRRPLDFVARGFCETVAGLRIPHIASTTQAYVTVSIGVATVDARDDASHDFTLRLADSALYAAKEQGRDRHVFSERPQESVAISPRKCGVPQLEYTPLMCILWR